jgi:hypothetical protein
MTSPPPLLHVVERGRGEVSGPAPYSFDYNGKTGVFDENKLSYNKGFQERRNQKSQNQKSEIVLYAKELFQNRLEKHA